MYAPRYAPLLQGLVGISGAGRRGGLGVEGWHHARLASLSGLAFDAAARACPRHPPSSTPGSGCLLHEEAAYFRADAQQHEQARVESHSSLAVALRIFSLNYYHFVADLLPQILLLAEAATSTAGKGATGVRKALLPRLVAQLCRKRVFQ